MRDAFTELVAAAHRLPEKIDDFQISRGPITESSLTPGGEAYLNRFRPWLDSVDWHHPVEGIRGSKQTRQRYELTYRMLAAHALGQIARTNPATLQKESTLAGSNVPTFTKQLIRTVLRAYPKLITPQLFPVQPLTMGPDGRIYFETTQYDTTFASSSPNVTAGTPTDILSSFNTDYYKQPVGQEQSLNQLKIDLSHYIVVSAQTYGLSSTNSLQAEQDFSSIYGRDLNATMSEKFQNHLQWVIDQVMIASAALYAPNSVTWKRQPTINSVAWANQLPSERTAWRETIWHDAFLPLFTQIYNRYYVRPNWVIASPSVAEDISRVSSFKPIEVDASTIDMRRGALRDMGTVDNGGVRVMVWPQLTTDTALFGYRPDDDFAPAHVYCPYIPIGFADDLVYPRQLKREKGAYTRFAVGQPDATVAESFHLSDCYGILYVSNAT